MAGNKLATSHGSTLESDIGEPSCETFRDQTAKASEKTADFYSLLPEFHCGSSFPMPGPVFSGFELVDRKILELLQEFNGFSVGHCKGDPYVEIMLRESKTEICNEIKHFADNWFDLGASVEQGPDFCHVGI